MKSIIRITLIFSVFLLAFLPKESNASFYKGGEIWWECTPQGNYRFHFIGYRECAACNYPATKTIQTSAPGFPSGITVTRISIEDISPDCNSSGPQIQCNGTPVYNTGAVEKHHFTSDAAYPNGVDLTGTPPANGWMFCFSSCCRPPSTNVPFSSNLSFTVKAIMYPHPGNSADTCFDSSPKFIAASLSAISTNSQLNYYPRVFDPDYDSLSIDWGLLNTNVTGTVSSAYYASGYDYNNPLPGKAVDTLNADPIIKNETGELILKSATSGAFVYSIKVKSYKNGILLAEIERDFQVIIRQESSNSPPFGGISGSYDYQADNDYFMEVDVGDTVSLLYNFGDASPGSVTGANDMIISVLGENLAEFSNPLSCPDPPCALVTDKDHNEYTNTTYNGVFDWETTCQHLKKNYNGKYPKGVYEFFFRVRDDFCPVPGRKEFRLEVTILDIETPVSPDSLDVVIDSLSIATICWNKADEISGDFQYYTVYYSFDQNGPFTAFDTIYDINQLSTTFDAGQGNHNITYWFCVTASDSGCIGIREAEPQLVIPALFTFGINEDSEQDKPFRIQPNPSDGIVYLKSLEYSGAVNYVIMDISGKVIMEDQYQAPAGSSKMIDLNQNGTGVYFLSVIAEERKYDFKIIVK